ncbi:arginase [Alkaliphilus metalliredigens QYMF]|uniref:Arginase n=1 Tax=Alkaliphilus metalliredigens (strain QYMF) TaxID=293826 RepID=A6TWC8_ALKMQ|nr:arginase [Alkaliphilus metalliredigens]ABR50496.1 arginase [Alkaliphilus metalliredigens QYMF]
MDINIIGVPIYYGADKRGPEYGPEKLREKKVASVLSKYNNKVYDMGDIHVPDVKDYDKFFSHANLKYLDAIMEVNKNLAHTVYSSLMSESFPLVIGGDHSIALGSISGVSRAHKNFAVVWMDAHGDINTQDTSGSGNIHGMPLAKLMNVGHEGLTNVYFQGQKVKPENVFIIGARDLDLGEIALIDKMKLNVYSADEIIEKGINEVMQAVMNKLKVNHVEAIHLSFDLDFIDAEFVPGTGTPVSVGINVDDTKKALKTLAESKLIKSMDFVELNVLLDKNDITADLAIDLLDWTFKHM